MQLPTLTADTIYTWDDLGPLFGFKPKWLGAVGGMAPRPELGAVLLITHPGGAKSFDYHDHWDGDTLVYTGRGKTGDQHLVGANKYVAEGDHTLYVFEGGVGPRKLRFLGTARCTSWGWSQGPDSTGKPRKVLQFRLTFPKGDQVSPVTKAVTTAKGFGGGESDAHKALKEWVAANPTAVGLPADAVADIEHSFRSPDRADIVFSLLDNRWVAVEVELEGTTNTTVGAWQAIKYRTLLCLEHGLPVSSARVSCLLVAHSIPEATRAFCQRYDVSCFEVPVAKVMGRQD